MSLFKAINSHTQGGGLDGGKIGHSYARQDEVKGEWLAYRQAPIRLNPLERN